MVTRRSHSMMRKKDPALRDGKMIMLDGNNPSVLSYVREGVGGQPSILVAVNCTAEPQAIFLDATAADVCMANRCTPC